ncbi:MAG: hypothetical protein IPK22_23765 [Verrucomicrobiaceae bacterium]|nr:hypothetical protein [Verrucomicrobiaceae bacterium]
MTSKTGVERKPESPSGSSAAQLASLTAEMLKVRVFKMEEGGDPHWLARHFLRKCDHSWEKYKRENQPNWSVSPFEIATVAVSLMRHSFLPQNGFEHCNLPKMPIQDIAVAWIVGAHHVLSIEQDMEREEQERGETLRELDAYWKQLEGTCDELVPTQKELSVLGQSKERFESLTTTEKRHVREEILRSRGGWSIPLSLVLKMAGCDELKPTASELASLGHSEKSFRELSSPDKHCIRLRILREYEVHLDLHPYSGKKPERMGPPVRLLPYSASQVRDGLYPLSLSTAEDILALRKAKQQRLRAVRAEASRSRKPSNHTASKNKGRNRERI